MTISVIKTAINMGPVNITSGINAKIHQVQITLLFVYTTTHEKLVILTCRYFKLN